MNKLGAGKSIAKGTTLQVDVVSKERVQNKL